MRPALGQPLEVFFVAEDRIGLAQVSKQASLEPTLDDVAAQVIGPRPPLPSQQGLGVLEPLLGDVLQLLSVHCVNSDAPIDRNAFMHLGFYAVTPPPAIPITPAHPSFGSASSGKGDIHVLT